MDSNYIRSSRRNPCPVCGRTKDGDCSWNENLVLCHTYIDGNDDIKGCKYRKQSQCGTWGVFAIEDTSVDSKPAREPSKSEYVYTLNHDPVVKVTRFDRRDRHKTFAQSRYEKGRWVPGLTDKTKTRIHLYQYENFLNQRAIKEGSHILIVEGEGKVDKLLNLGIPAVCAIGGAGKWRRYGYPNYLDDLNGAKIVLCPDRDLPGIKHCEDIADDFSEAQWLYAFPDSPEWEGKLPKKGGLDLADWISSGATKEQILAAIRAKKYQLQIHHHHWQPLADIASLRLIST
jgi:hypothetical protein